MSQILSIAPATRAFTGTLKSSIRDAAIAFGDGSMTLALRDNGPKINGTLVLLNGALGKPGDVFNARNANTKGAYGPHLVLGNIEVANLGDAGPAFVNATEADFDIDIDFDTKVAVFQVA